MNDFCAFYFYFFKSDVEHCKDGSLEDIFYINVYQCLSKSKNAIILWYKIIWNNLYRHCLLLFRLHQYSKIKLHLLFIISYINYHYVEISHKMTDATPIVQHWRCSSPIVQHWRCSSPTVQHWQCSSPIVQHWRCS